FLAHADSRIRDCYLNLGSVCTSNGERKFTVLRELAAIAENVEQALLQFGAVRAYAANIVRNVNLEPVAVFCDQGSYDGANLSQQRGYLDLLDEYIHLARLNL